mmetsp:Transcript_270/g.448  ORF Transcript_270/g.448 Transcript_270/m.448 type:complete len:114 (+) Transcript_270:150-491(+)
MHQRQAIVTPVAPSLKFLKVGSTLKNDAESSQITEWNVGANKGEEAEIAAVEKFCARGKRNYCTQLQAASCKSARCVGPTVVIGASALRRRISMVPPNLLALGQRWRTGSRRG